MPKVAFIEFHFDFFFPLIDYFEKDGFEIVLWTSHRHTLQKLPKGIFRYRSRYAQIGLTPLGERISGYPDPSIEQALLKRKKMLLNQTRRFPVFSKWDSGLLWNHILAMAKFWNDLLDEMEIDTVLYKTEPHMLFDFILFLVTEERGKKNLFFERLPFDSRVIVCDSLDNKRNTIQERLSFHSKSKEDQYLSVLNNKVTEDLPFHYKFKRDRANKKKSFLKKLKRIIKPEYVKNFLNKKVRSYTREKELWEKIGANPAKVCKQSWPVFFAGKILRQICQKIIYKNLLALCNFILFRGKFERGGYLFCLPCQPERSSNPCGGPEYFDQITLIKDICSVLGSQKKLYVKEHPSQFSSYQLPDRGRSFKFYYKLLRLKNVILLPPLPTVETLIENAGCVISVGGTACWQALKNGVPAIICGQVAYAASENSLTGHNKVELEDSLKKVENINVPDNTISISANLFEHECKKISEKAYLDRIYENKFDRNYDNAQFLFKLIKQYLEYKALNQASDTAYFIQKDS